MSAAKPIVFADIDPEAPIDVVLSQLSGILQTLSPDFKLEARLFVMAATNLDKADLILHADRPIGRQAARALTQWIGRRQIGRAHV